jgi:hypothetical protein
VRKERVRRRGEAKIPGVQNSDFGFSRLSGHDES